MMGLRSQLSAGLLIKAKPHPPSTTSEVSGGTSHPGEGDAASHHFPWPPCC